MKQFAYIYQSVTAHSQSSLKLMDSNTDRKNPQTQRWTRREFWGFRIGFLIAAFLISFIGPTMISTYIVGRLTGWVYNYDKYQGHVDEVHVMNVNQDILKNPISSLYCKGNIYSFYSLKY